MSQEDVLVGRPHATNRPSCLEQEGEENQERGGRCRVREAHRRAQRAFELRRQEGRTHRKQQQKRQNMHVRVHNVPKRTSSDDVEPTRSLTHRGVVKLFLLNFLGFASVHRLTRLIASEPFVRRSDLRKRERHALTRACEGETNERSLNAAPTEH